MAKDIVMPALGMAQETGTLLQWLKKPGEAVEKGELLMEVETDKATVEIEAPASGILSNVSARPGDVVPVGQTIAQILTAAEAEKAESPPTKPTRPPLEETRAAPSLATQPAQPIKITPVARRVAAEHNLDVSQVKPAGPRVQKDDVLNHLAAQGKPARSGRPLASPKARRLAQENSLDLGAIAGSGPDGAVLAADIVRALKHSDSERADKGPEERALAVVPGTPTETLTVSRLWRVMADRLTQAWTTIPHFYLIRECRAASLGAWLAEARQRAEIKITYTDLLVKLVAAALRKHPRLNGSWSDGAITLNPDVNVGLAVANDDGLVVPVIHRADTLGIGQIAARRAEIVAMAQSGKLPPDVLSGGTFTISNLGMYGVDAFSAIVNPPQAAILAVSRIADRVVPVNGQPAVVSMLTLSLSCDHRVVDGARGAQFLQTLAELIESPMQLLD